MCKHTHARTQKPGGGGGRGGGSVNLRDELLVAKLFASVHGEGAGPAAEAVTFGPVLAAVAHLNIRHSSNFLKLHAVQF